MPSLLLVLLILVAAPPQVQEVRDDFGSYTSGSTAGPQWSTGAIGWSVQEGALTSEGAGRSLAHHRRIGFGRELWVECRITPRRAAGEEWKTAGIAIIYDDRNYWHLALAERPNSLDRGRFVELTEMKDGRWLANFEGDTRLEPLPDGVGDFAWEYGRPYVLRLALTDDAIAATVTDAEGRVCWRSGFRLNEKAVRTGRPHLFTNGLAATFDDFAAAIVRPAEGPPERTFPPYAGPAMGPRIARPTGFFRVRQEGPVWWIVDPNGRAFYAVGIDHVNYNVHWCEALGYAPYARNVAAKYGSEEKWAASAVARLKQWGFNSLGANNSPSTRYRGLPHTEFLSFGMAFTSVSDIVPRTTWTGFPDVFHPGFPEWCRQEAQRQCRPLRNDPWLLGYFLDNELEWFGKSGSEVGLLEEALKKPASHPAKRALLADLQARYGDIGSFNTAWKTRFPSWESLAEEAPAVQTPEARRDGLRFVAKVADLYFRYTTAAVREADPNHLILGCRFAGTAPPGVIAAAGRYCDVVSVNYYGEVDLERGIVTDMPNRMRQYYAEARKPLMLTEWSFPALDAGLPSQHGAGQRVPTQRDKAHAFDIYQRALFSMPFMVGSNYFMWVDEPALGISKTFPEDSNYGLVDVNDNAWPELTRMAARTNRLALDLHAGRTVEVAVSIRGQRGGVAVAVRNTGTREGRVPIRIWVQNRSTDRVLRIAPGAQQVIHMPLAAPALVVASADPEGRLTERNRADNVAVHTFIPANTARPLIVVANPTSGTIDNAVIAIPLAGLGNGWQPGRAAGSLAWQVDALPEGTEMALRLERIAPRSLVVLPLRRGPAAMSNQITSGDRPLHLDGVLRLERDPGSGAFADRVYHGETLLGSYWCVVHQANGQPLWVRPDRMESLSVHVGPVRTVAYYTMALARPENAAPTTQASAEGQYAPQTRRPHAFRTTYRLDFYPDEPWFAARFLRILNTDDSPWRLAAYYHYPLSRIGGGAENDQPRNARAAPVWFDPDTKYAYGAVLVGEGLKSYFWKDAPNSAAEHPDIYRTVNRVLQPGQTFVASRTEPYVILHGGPAASSDPGGISAKRVKSLHSLQVQLLR